MKKTQLRGAFLAIIATVAAGVSAQAQNYVANGGFANLSHGSGKQLSGPSDTGYTEAFSWFTVWSASGSNNWSTHEALAVVGDSTSLSQTGNGAENAFGSPINGSPIKFWGSIPSSPNGGNFVAHYSEYQTTFTHIGQTISGLTVGLEYNLTFEWAGAQQLGYSGASVARWNVEIGELSASTDYIDVPNNGFSGWTTATFKFTATDVSMDLYFNAEGDLESDHSLPAPGTFSLIDGVSITPVPEPSTYAAVTGGLLVLVGVARRRMTK